ncbi:hypothetical protein FRC07_003789 [Ceratobasidium sp. 392]|nr:hypothetical protein FRC07_003789 [Ceratobasidium sp. 392]
MSSQPPSRSTATPAPTGHIRSSGLAPAANRALTAAAAQEIVMLKSDLEHAMDQIKVLRGSVVQLEGRDEESHGQIRTLAARLKVSEARCEKLEAQLAHLLEAVGVETVSVPLVATYATPAAHTGAPALEPALDHAPAPVPATSAPKAESLDSINANPLKDVKLAAMAALACIYGVPKFRMKDHGDYPPYTKDHVNWPHRMEGNSRVPVTRFDFTEAYDSAKNKESYELWISITLSQGKHLAGVGHLTESNFNRKTVVQAIGRIYSSFKTQYRTKVTKRGPPSVPIKRKVEAVNNGIEDVLGNNASTTDDLTDFSFTEFMQSGSVDLEQLPLDDSQLDHTIHATPHSFASDVPAADTLPVAATSSYGVGNSNPGDFHSRRVARCNTRANKRKALQGDARKYLSTKFDSYFTPGAMSDDEVIVDSVNDQGRVTASHLESHQYEWASNELIAIQDAIDKVPGSSLNKTVRVRGPNKVGKPHSSYTIEGGIRTWMVKPEVLEENPDWRDSGLVYPSGAEWGEEEPSNAQDTRQAAKRIRAVAGPGLARLQEANSKVQLAMAELDEINDLHMY